VQYLYKEVKQPIEIFRLMIVATLSACQRYRIMVEYNQEKLKEIGKVKRAAGI